MGKVITVNVHCTNGYTYVTDSHYWHKDSGNRLVIKGLGLKTGAQVHFSLTEKTGIPIPMIGIEEDGVFIVDLPNRILQDVRKKKDYEIYVFVYNTSEIGGWTEHEIIIPVRIRPNLPYENPTSEDLNAFDRAVELVKGYAEFTQTTAESFESDREQIWQNAEDIANLKEHGTGGGSGILHQATEDALGGIKASPKTEAETVEAKIGEDGKLYVPTYTKSEQITVDSKLDKESTNPVQNKVVTEAIDKFSEEGSFNLTVRPVPVYKVENLFDMILMNRVDLTQLEEGVSYGLIPEDTTMPNNIDLRVRCDDGTEKIVLSFGSYLRFGVTSKTDTTISFMVIDTDVLFVVDFADKSTANNIKVSRILQGDYIHLNDTREYTPTSDYHPATKKYVDDKATSFIVNLSVSDPDEFSIEADKTYEEIVAAWNKQQPIFVLFEDEVYTCVYYNSVFKFGGCYVYGEPSMPDHDACFKVLNLSEDNTWRATFRVNCLTTSEYSELNTTSKNIINAINEVNAKTDVLIVTSTNNVSSHSAEEIYNAMNEGKICLFHDGFRAYQLSYAEIDPSHYAEFFHQSTGWTRYVYINGSAVSYRTNDIGLSDKLQTESKYVVGAINELYDMITALQ